MFFADSVAKYQNLKSPDLKTSDLVKPQPTPPMEWSLESSKLHLQCRQRFYLDAPVSNGALVQSYSTPPRDVKLMSQIWGCRLQWGEQIPPPDQRPPLDMWKSELEGRKEMFYLMMHSTHFIYGYMASDIWLRIILIVREETRCCHIGYSFWLAARVLLYAPSHRQNKGVGRRI